MVVTFLSDFGLQDDFVGVCHGVIKRIAPAADILDITHGISRQNVLQGALVLAGALPYMPAGVHLAVVDPGVGGARRGIALRDGSGRLYVGPDNGLLLIAAERFGGVEAARELTARQFMLEPVSQTFHGRDVFAPVAAHLARGAALEELGVSLDSAALVQLEQPRVEVAEDGIHATVLAVDRYGNVQLNATWNELEALGVAGGTRVELGGALHRSSATFARTFSAAGPGDVILYVDASGYVAVAVNGGDAAERLALRAGEALTVRIPA